MSMRRFGDPRTGSKVQQSTDFRLFRVQLGNMGMSENGVYPQL